jgi:hypothetical protein
VHVRAILFDSLWSFGQGMYLWADRSINEVGTSQNIDGYRTTVSFAVPLDGSPSPGVHIG